MAKAKPAPQAENEMQSANSYARLIAEGIYNSYNLGLSSKEIEQQLQADDSFYKDLLSVPARNLYNQICIDHCRELEDIIYDELGEVKIQQVRKHEENPELASGLIDQYLTQIEPEIKNYAQQLESLEHEQTQDEKLREVNRQLIEEWQTAHRENAKNICAELKDSGFDLADDFEQRLQKRLEQSAADAEIPEDILKQLKLKKGATMVQKAVIATLMEDELV